MKNYNKIIEAINNGIQLALDDFDDEEQVQNIKSKQINHRDYTKEYLDLLRDEVVDLGLPSGTLWCKYNLGATCENTPESWYGDYYAWGELIPNKDQWNEALYKFTGKMKKYNNYDNLFNLLPEDDAAYQFKKCHNYKFHIPIKDQCEELIQYTTVSEYQENYNNVIGLNGYILTSNINNNKIFIPMAGYYGFNGFQNFRAALSCATRYENDPYRCYILQYYSRGGEFILNNALYRTNGFPIRPVINL